MPIPPLVDPVPSLAAAERERAARHLRLRGLGPFGQRRIAAARVGVIGAGGLGSPVVLALAAAGVGEMVVFDDDTVDLSNLQRQVIHRLADVGAPKTDSAVRVASDLSPTRVRAVRERLTPANARNLLAGLDLILDGTDSFSSREIVAAASEQLGTPVVWGSVQEYAGQVTIFWSAPPEPYPPVRLHDLYAPGSDAPTCSAVGVLGPVCLQVGAAMATEALKLIAGIGEPLLGRVLLIDALTATPRVIPLAPAHTGGDASAPAAPAHAAQHSTAPAPAPARTPIAQVDEPDPQAVIVDVREIDEVRGGTLPGAVHLPLGDLLASPEQAASAHGLHRRPAVLVCHIGQRALVAAEALREVGVEASVLRGGMSGWTRRREGAR